MITLSNGLTLDTDGDGNYFPATSTAATSTAAAPISYTPGPLTVDPNQAVEDPSKVNAQVMRAQWDDYYQNVRPIEDELLKQYSDFNFTDEMQQAYQRVAAQQGIAADARGRIMQRQGITQTAEQKAANDRNASLGNALDITTATNQTQRNLYDRNLAGINDLYAVGSGVGRSAQAALSQAGGLADARNNQNDANKAAYKAQRQSQLLSGAGLGASLGMTAGLGSLAAAGTASAGFGGAALGALLTFF